MCTYLMFIAFAISVCMVKSLMHVKQMLTWEIPYNYLHSVHDYPGSHTNEPPIIAIAIDAINGTLNAFTEDKLLYFDLHEPQDRTDHKYWSQTPAVNPLNPSELLRLQLKQDRVYGYPMINVEGQASVQVGDWLYFWNSMNEEYVFQKYNAITREIKTLPYDFPVHGSCLAYCNHRKSIFMFGGIVADSNARYAHSKLMEFKIHSEKWLLLHHGKLMPYLALSFSGCAFDRDEERFFAFGGKTTGHITSFIPYYFITKGDWYDPMVRGQPQLELGDGLEHRLYDLQCNLFSVDDNIYCVGGIYSDGTHEIVSKAVYMLDPRNIPTSPTNKVYLPSSGLELNQPRAGAQLKEINNCLWIVGGYQEALTATSQPLTTIAGIGYGYDDCKLLPQRIKKR